jgi:SAM-dependent methyltransferase
MDDAVNSWDAAYRGNQPPWDIDRPQQAFRRLFETEEIRPPVLDSGCGTGEHALLLAERGLDVFGIDLAPTAIASARSKAAGRGLNVEFAVGNVLALDQLGRRFGAVIDSGVFHVFDDVDRARYVESLAAVLELGGALHLLCFSEETPGSDGPRRVTQAELHAAFASGWLVARIEPTVLEVRARFFAEPPRGWLAKIVRTL